METANRSGIVYDIIGKSNRNQMMLCVGTALVVLAFALFNYRYLANFFLGPQSVTAQEISRMTNPNNQLRYYVTTSGEKSLDSGWQMVETSDSGDKRVESGYGLLIVDRKLLLIKTNGAFTENTQFTGALIPIPNDVQSKVVDSLEQEEPSIKGAILPFMLDTTDFRQIGYIGLLVGAILYAICIWGIIRTVRRSENPLNHPIMKSLQRYGDPAALAVQIDDEMRQEHTQVSKNLHITPNWLLQASPSTLQAARLDDVMWAYKMVTQHRTNGIPTRKTYSTKIWDRYGKCTTLAGKEAFVNQTLEAVARRIPYAIFGYSPQILQTWNSNRQGFIASVDQRRTQMRSST